MSASFVLASLRGSTYPKGTPQPSSLAAAALNGHFEHPAAVFCRCAARLHSLQTHIGIHEVLARPQSFSPAREPLQSSGRWLRSLTVAIPLPIAKYNFSLRKTSWLPLVSMA